MEQRKVPITAFIKPLLHTLQLTTEEPSATTYVEVMPLFDVIETIHHSYYFKQTIVVTFEQYAADGTLIRLTKTGTAKTRIQDNNHFVFDSDDITYLLTLEQVVAAVEYPLTKKSDEIIRK